MAYEASGAAYAITLAPIYYTLGNSRPKRSSSGRSGDTDMNSDRVIHDCRQLIWMGWQLPAMRCTTLGTADVPTVSSSGHGDQLHQVAQSAELPEARAGHPSRAAVARRGCGNPRHTGKGSNNFLIFPLSRKLILKYEKPLLLISTQDPCLANRQCSSVDLVCGLQGNIEYERRVVGLVPLGARACVHVGRCPICCHSEPLVNVTRDVVARAYPSLQLV